MLMHEKTCMIPIFEEEIKSCLDNANLHAFHENSNHIQVIKKVISLRNISKVFSHFKQLMYHCFLSYCFAIYYIFSTTVYLNVFKTFRTIKCVI